MAEHRLCIYMSAYDPYKDLFDIFMQQFEKYWPDCPYPLVISNMYFEYERENTIVIHCGDMKNASERKKYAIRAVDADYYLGMEEDRVFMDRIDTVEIEKILDFMDKKNVPYFRCNASIFKKKEIDRFKGYEHYYHIPAKEPYGVCGSTVIWRKDLLFQREKDNTDNGYNWESFQNKRAALSNEKWVENNFATDDRNVFNILHCVEKQKWIASAKRKIQKEGYVIEKQSRNVETFYETLVLHIKDLFKRFPGKTRYRIKKALKKLGFHFETDY